MKCIICGKQLKGLQKKFCSIKCQRKYAADIALYRYHHDEEFRKKHDKVMKKYHSTPKFKKRNVAFVDQYRKTHPEYYAACKKGAAAYQKKRYETDPKFRKYVIEHAQKYNKKRAKKRYCKTCGKRLKDPRIRYCKPHAIKAYIMQHREAARNYERRRAALKRVGAIR